VRASGCAWLSRLSLGCQISRMPVIAFAQIYLQEPYRAA
jgi:hypothetical protein